jgi:DNA-binding transcriptional ArsR family regulator
MGTSKTEEFTNKQNEIANMARAISHPARVTILEYLLKVNVCACGDIVKELPLAQATISQHLKKLKNAGIIKIVIDGSSICYCIDEKNWIKFQKTLNGFFDKTQKNPKRGL